MKEIQVGDRVRLKKGVRFCMGKQTGLRVKEISGIGRQFVELTSDGKPEGRVYACLDELVKVK